MAISFISATASGTASGFGVAGNGDSTVVLPSYSAGDLGIILVYLDSGTCTIDQGWSIVSGAPWGSNTPKLYAFYKILGASETNPTFTTAATGGTTHASVAGAIVYREVNPTNPIHVVGSATSGTGTPNTCTGITTTVNNTMLLGLCGRGDNEVYSGQTVNSSTSGVTERLDAGTASGDDAQVSIYDKLITTAGATGNGSATTSPNDPYVSVFISLTPVIASMDAEPDSFILSGKDADFILGYPMDAATGNFTVSGQDASLSRTYYMTAEKGTFTLTGNNASTTANHYLSADKQSYNSVFNDAELIYAPLALNHYVMDCMQAVGYQPLRDVDGNFVYDIDGELVWIISDVSHNVVGWNANLSIAQLNHYVLNAEHTEGYTPLFDVDGNPVLDIDDNQIYVIADTTYSTAGWNVTFEYTPAAKVLNTETRQFVLAGNDSQVLVSRQLQADKQTYTLTGNNVSVTAGRLLNADKQTYVLIGNNTALTSQRLLNADKQSYTLTSNNVVFNRTYILQADKQTYTITFNDAQLVKVGMYSINAEKAGYILTGNDVAFRYFNMPAETGVFTLNGKPVTFNSSKSIDAGKGTYVFTGNDVSFLYNRILQANKQTYSITGRDAVLTRGLFISAQAQSYLLNGNNVIFDIGRGIVADLGQFVLNGKNADLIYYGLNRDLIAETGKFILTGNPSMMSLPSIMYYRANNQWIELGKFIK